METSDPTWMRQLVRHDDYAAIGAQSTLRTAVQHGLFCRVAHGIYVPSAVAQEWDVDARFRALVHATSLRHPDEVFSHFSAAALWRLPNLDQWPDRPESSIDATSGGRSRACIRRRAVGRPARHTTVDGIAVTCLARTVVDLASIARFSQAVAVADSALAGLVVAGDVSRHPIGRSELDAELGWRREQRGARRRQRVIDFADAGAGSPGESLSRVAIHMLGFPKPELQVPFFDSDGLIGYVDFWWPYCGVIGEFDGKGKYLRDELRGGRSIAEVVMQEKAREDRLRAAPGVRAVVRWGWAVARSPRLLESKLRAAGVASGRVARLEP